MSEKFHKKCQDTSSLWRVLDPFCVYGMCTIYGSIFSSDNSAIYTGHKESPYYVWYFNPSHMGGQSKLVLWMGFQTHFCQWYGSGCPIFRGTHFPTDTGHEESRLYGGEHARLSGKTPTFWVPFLPKNVINWDPKCHKLGPILTKFTDLLNLLILPIRPARAVSVFQKSMKITPKA